MGREGSVAPKERVNITYKPATGDAKEERELPLKILAMGYYTGRPDDRSLEERKPVNIDKDNFNEVMASHELALNMNVEDRLSGDAGAEMAVSLKFDTLKDFGPERIAEQVPELRQLMQLRGALTALKGPLGNIPAFRKKLQGMLGDDDSRKRLMTELGINEDGNEG
jgi:type VI secretion system protein ImpB